MRTWSTRGAAVVAALGCALLAGCSTTVGPSDSETSTPPSDRAAAETSESISLRDAAVDAVNAVGRGAAISAQRNGDDWDVIVSSHAGQTWQVAGLPDSDATADDVEVSDETAEINGRVRTVLDTAPLLDERADDVVAAAGASGVESVVLEDRGDEIVWTVTATDGTTSDVDATP